MINVEKKAEYLERVRAELKQNLNIYLATTAALDEIEALQEAAPENEALDKEWDEAYKRHFEAYKKAENILIEILEVSASTARRMIAEHAAMIEAEL